MILSSIILSYACLVVAGRVDVVYEWKYIDYLWKSDDHKKAAIESGAYDPTMVFPIDVEVTKGAVFVTTPKQAGVPASLSTISNICGPGGPLLKPFPNWSWHARSDCSGITSVWRVVVDDCGRLWVLDTGKVDEVQLCPAQLLTFDTYTYRLLKRYIIPDTLLYGSRTNGTGLLVTPVVETRNACRETWVYIADVDGRGLIIVKFVREKRAWRLDNEVFSPSPQADTYTIAGENFQLADGVLGLAVTPRFGKSKDRRLFFRPLASYNLFSVSVDELHDSLFREIMYAKSDYELPSQAAALAFSDDGTLFFGLTTEIAIACWNIHTVLRENNVVIVAQNNETLQFVSGIKVKQVYHRGFADENLWVLTNRFQKIMAGTQNFEETNFRILKGSVRQLLAGTNCQHW